MGDRTFNNRYLMVQPIKDFPCAVLAALLVSCFEELPQLHRFKEREILNDRFDYGPDARTGSNRYVTLTLCKLNRDRSVASVRHCSSLSRSRRGGYKFAAVLTLEECD